MKTMFITSRIVSQKCRYALRAIFELASRDKAEVAKISEIAAAQAISPRFLENILVELKQAGFVTSRRGNEGGYMLAVPASELTVGEVIGFVQGLSGKNSDSIGTAHNGDYAFSQFWRRLNGAISDTYNSITFADLVEEELKAAKNYVPNYVI